MFKEYDKLDIIIDLTIQNLGISREEFKARESNGKKEKPYILLNKTPEAINYCDGDRCQVPVLLTSKC